MTKYTPGPWVYRRGTVRPGDWLTRDREKIVFIADDAWQDEENDWQTTILDTLNSHAALLEAAEAFVAINECACPTPDDMPYEDDLVFSEWIKKNRCHWHRARAAIAAAKGVE